MLRKTKEILSLNYDDDDLSDWCVSFFFTDPLCLLSIIFTSIRFSHSTLDTACFFSMSICSSLNLIELSSSFFFCFLSQILSRSSSIGSTSGGDSTPSRPETRTIRRAESEHIASINSSKFCDHDQIRSATVTKYRSTDDNQLSDISTPDIID